MTGRPSTPLAPLSQRSATLVPVSPASLHVRLRCFGMAMALLVLLSVVPSLALGQATRLSGDGDQTFLDRELTPEFLEQYEAKLNAILKTRQNEEKKFVADLVANVRAGKLPIKLVSTSFKWVQENRPDSNYPFIYFEKVLRLQAAQLDLADSVPPYEFTPFLSAGQRRVDSPAQQEDSDANSSNAVDTPDQPRLITLIGSASGKVAELFRLGSSKLKLR